MRSILFVTLLFSGAAIAQTPATPAPAANTVVEFVHPEKFIDASDRGFGATPSDRVLNGLRTALVALGAKYLGPGQSLKIDVTDIDLAGRFEPMLRPEPVRVLRDADWPRISLHYVQKQDGDVVRQGDERIADLNYLRQQPPLQTGEPLYYEKRMLADWFARTFGSRSRPPQ